MLPPIPLGLVFLNIPSSRKPSYCLMRYQFIHQQPNQLAQELLEEQSYIIFIILIMQSNQPSASKCTSFFRSKAQSFQQPKKTNDSSSYDHLDFSSLSLSMDLTNFSNSRRISPENLIEYIQEVLENICKADPISFKSTYREFLKQRSQELKGKMTERLSLLNYLQESLKYKSFSEIDLEMQKEWRKNALFFSISTIWAKCILLHQFKNQEEFVSEYEKHRNFIANVTQFYFRGSLKILLSKKVETLTLIYEDTAHQIINNFKEWKGIYQGKLIPLLRKTGKFGTIYQQNSQDQEEEEINMDYDLSELKVNPQYLNPKEKENQLKNTTECIKQFAREYKIHEKIALLKKIRSNFMAELTENSAKIATEKGLKHLSPLEKDDILDCMIYCIIRGEIKDVGMSLKALMLLVGKNSDLLSKKGVDSYRADLQGAIQYLCHRQLSSPLIKLPRNLMSTQVTSFM